MVKVTDHQTLFLGKEPTLNQAPRLRSPGFRLKLLFILMTNRQSLVIYTSVEREAIGEKIQGK